MVKSAKIVWCYLHRVCNCNTHFQNTDCNAVSVKHCSSCQLMKISGSVAVVFGGARGIGRAYAEALLERGAKVCISDVLVEEGKKIVEKYQAKYSLEKIFFILCDVTNEQHVKDVFQATTERFGSVNIVVSSCGIMHEFDWQKCIDINLGGTIRVVNEARDRMGKDKGKTGGIVIVTSSIAGLRPHAHIPVYTATKHGIVGYIRAWAVRCVETSWMEINYKDHGIRMNCICPTGVNTKLLNQITEDRVHYGSAIRDEMTQLQAADRLNPEDVAMAMVQLIEDDTANGQAMRVTKQYGCDFAVFQEHPMQ